MRRIAYIIIGTSMMMSSFACCNQNKQSVQNENDTSVGVSCKHQNVISPKEPMSCKDDETNKSIHLRDTMHSFFGRPISINDSVIEQISAIAKQDNKLSYSDSIIQICDVKWRINLRLPYIVLLTSINPDEPQMKQVVNYLNKIYGKPYDDDEKPVDIKWSSSPDSNNPLSGGYTLVHFRRVHTEEGGTTLIFY